MQPVWNVGVDVAKDTVVVACAEHHFPVHPVRNQRTALRTWLKSLPAGSRLGLESTGTYHELLADLAHAHGHTVYLLNPMETRRATLVRIKSMLKLTMSNLGGFASDVKAVVRKLDALLAKLDATMATLVAQSAEHREAQDRIETIVGVGPLVGLSLTNTLERVPFRNADAFVAFTGLAPRAKDSGQKSGRRRLSKRGPAELRRLLFTAAMSAVRTTVWKPIYESYRTQGWSSTAAFVIIARKIARAAWSVYSSVSHHL